MKAPKKQGNSLLTRNLETVMNYFYQLLLTDQLPYWKRNDPPRPYQLREPVQAAGRFSQLDHQEPHPEKAPKNDSESIDKSQ
jgi:hypothetical protein